jgi:hypothetical protein
MRLNRDHYPALEVTRRPATSAGLRSPWVLPLIAAYDHTELNDDLRPSPLRISKLAQDLSICKMISVATFDVAFRMSEVGGLATCKRLDRISAFRPS